MKMKRLLVAILLQGMLAIPLSAGAATLSLVPERTTVNVGESVSVELMIAGLGDGQAPSVGDYDLDIAWDPAIFTIELVEFDSFLGNPEIGDEVLTGSDVVGPGLLDLFAVSLLPALELNAGQPAAFRLASITFLALAPGTGAFDITAAIVDDANAMPIDVTLTGASVTVVPLPASFGSFLLAMAALAGARRHRASRGSPATAIGSAARAGPLRP